MEVYQVACKDGGLYTVLCALLFLLSSAYTCCTAGNEMGGGCVSLGDCLSSPSYSYIGLLWPMLQVKVFASV